jgi:type I restriction enzyme M protein
LARDKKNNKFRDRRGEVLFIDARKLGHMVDRTRKEFSDEDLAKITGAYHAWRGEKDAIAERGPYQDVPGFCKSATRDLIRTQSHVLTPGRYVGAADVEDDDMPFEERLAELNTQLADQFAEADRLKDAILKRLAGVRSYG